jgi:subtilisin family serine protease
VSHRSLRSTLVPFASGLAAVIAVSWAAPALGVVGRPADGNAVRAQEWWLADLHADQAWQTTEGTGVTVAVLGTGVAAGHSDLAGAVITGPDLSDSGRVSGGAFWGVDGTAVAGVIAGHGHGAGGESGITGIAPAARILSIRVNLEFNDPLNSDPAITRRLPGAIASGIIYAVDHGARVIDLPLDPGTFGLTGSGDPAAADGSPAEQAAVDYALRKSVVLIAPAGDDGQGPGLMNYPAAYAGVIAVGAVGRDGRLAAFSTRRSYVSLTAPGADLVAAAPPDGYSSFSSTSTASGIVAGIAALIVSRFPHLTAAQVTQALTRSTAGTGGTVAATAGPGTGHGTVDAVRAVDLAAAISSAGQPRPPATPTAKPVKPPPRPAAAPHLASASALAGSLVRDVVAALGALIVLLVVLLLIMTSRRRRRLAGGSRAVRGQPQAAPGAHGRRRSDRGAGPAPEPAGPRTAVWPPLAGPALAPP